MIRKLIAVAALAGLSGLAVGNHLASSTAKPDPSEVTLGEAYACGVMGELHYELQKAGVTEPEPEFCPPYRAAAAHSGFHAATLFYTGKSL